MLECLRIRRAAASLAAGLLVATTGVAHAGPVLFNFSGSLQTFDVTEPGDYRIVAAGAAGGTVQSGGASGLGAWAEAVFTFNGTEQLQIIVGGRPGLTTDAAGGGGGSFVFLPPDPNVLLGLPIPLVVGGGGGGAIFSQVGDISGRNASLGPNGTARVGTFGGVGGTGGTGGVAGSSSTGPGSGAGGGGGFFTGGGGSPQGTSRGGEAAILGGDGGEGFQDGGFGGGGAAVFFAGGGGYSGGGGGGSDAGGGGGGGGGSFVNEDFGGYIPSSSVFKLLGESSHGFVVIEFLGRGSGTPVPLPGTLALAGLAGLALIATRRRSSRR